MHERSQKKPQRKAKKNTLQQALETWANFDVPGKENVKRHLFVYQSRPENRSVRNIDAAYLLGAFTQEYLAVASDRLYSQKDSLVDDFFTSATESLEDMMRELRVTSGRDSENFCGIIEHLFGYIRSSDPDTAASAFFDIPILLEEYLSKNKLIGELYHSMRKDHLHDEWIAPTSADVHLSMRQIRGPDVEIVEFKIAKKISPTPALTYGY